MGRRKVGGAGCSFVYNIRKFSRGHNVRLNEEKFNGSVDDGTTAIEDGKIDEMVLCQNDSQSYAF